MVSHRVFAPLYFYDLLCEAVYMPFLLPSSRAFAIVKQHFFIGYNTFWQMFT